MPSIVAVGTTDETVVPEGPEATAAINVGVEAQLSSASIITKLSASWALKEIDERKTAIKISDFQTICKWFVLDTVEILNVFKIKDL